MHCSYLIGMILILVSFNLGSRKESGCLAEEKQSGANHIQIKQNIYNPLSVTRKPTLDGKRIKDFSNEKKCNSESECVPWAFCNISSCACRESLEDENILKCDKNTLELSMIKGYCVTYNNSTGHMFVGMCIENKLHRSLHSTSDSSFWNQSIHVCW